MKTTSQIVIVVWNWIDFFFNAECHRTLDWCMTLNICENLNKAQNHAIWFVCLAFASMSFECMIFFFEETTTNPNGTGRNKREKKIRECAPSNQKTKTNYVNLNEWIIPFYSVDYKECVVIWRFYFAISSVILFFLVFSPCWYIFLPTLYPAIVCVFVSVMFANTFWHSAKSME